MVFANIEGGLCRARRRRLVGRCGVVGLVIDRHLFGFVSRVLRRFWRRGMRHGVEDVHALAAAYFATRACEVFGLDREHGVASRAASF
ncbi:MAG: hypothetical protein AAGK78_00100, partial [Planctomycetota bacterium]